MTEETPKAAVVTMPAAAISVQVELGGQRILTLQSYFKPDDPAIVVNKAADTLVRVSERHRARVDLRAMKKDLIKLEDVLADFDTDRKRIEEERSRKINGLKDQILEAEEAVVSAGQHDRKMYSASQRRGEYRPSNTLEGATRAAALEVKKLEDQIKAEETDRAQRVKEADAMRPRYLRNIERLQAEIAETEALAAEFAQAAE